MVDTDKILSIKNLKVKLYINNIVINAVNGINLSINKGETIAIVGESGSGKSTLALSILGLLPKITKDSMEGSIYFEDKNILDYTNNYIEKIRGDKISIIYQDPLTSLNPVKRIGNQIKESILKYQDISKYDAEKETITLLSSVGIKNVKDRVHQFPHNFSGGMRQRVMIAMAISNNPSILIADEATTSLDVTTQIQIVNLLSDIQNKTGMSIIWITHDLSLASRIANRVVVMYAGKILEEASAKSLYNKPFHPYTNALLQAVPQLDTKRVTRFKNINGNISNSLGINNSCVYEPRCDQSFNDCMTHPPNILLDDEHNVACWLYKGQ